VTETDLAPDQRGIAVRLAGQDTFSGQLSTLDRQSNALAGEGVNQAGRIANKQGAGSGNWLPASAQSSWVVSIVPIKNKLGG